MEETFDSKMIQLMLSVLVQHLEEVYEDFMECVWSRDSAKEKEPDEAAETPDAPETPAK